MKKIIRLVTALTLISAVCAAVLATVNAVTRDRIENIKEQMKQNAARIVLPRSVRNVEPAGDAVFTGKAADGRILAYAVIGHCAAGYGGPIELMVGFTKDFQIVTYQKLRATETPGLGTHLSSPAFMKQFKGLDAKKDIKVTKDGGVIEAITAATITSRAVCGAVNDARAKLQAHLAAAH